jgi:hypothetical protein
MLIDALLRGVMATAAFTLVVNVQVCGDNRLVPSLPLVRYAFGSALAFSLSTGPTALVEVVSSRILSSWGRDLAAGLLALAIAYACHLLSPMVEVYAGIFTANWSSPGAVLEGLANPNVEFHLLPTSRMQILGGLVTALPFGLLILVRLRGLGLATQAAILVPTLGATMLAFEKRSHAEPTGIRYSVTLALLSGIVVPLAAVLARRAEGRLFAWLTRAPADPPANPVLGLRPRSVIPALPVVALLTVILVVGVRLRFPNPPRPPGPSPAERALTARWKSFQAGKLKPSEVAELCQKTVEVTHHVRRRVGEDDPVFVERKVRVAGTSEYDCKVTTTISLDGASFPGRPWGPIGTWWPGTQCIRVLRDLERGEHTIAFVSSFSLVSGRTAVIWSGTFQSWSTFEVVSGSVRSELKLVHPADYDPDEIEIEQRPHDPVYLWITARKVRATVRSNAEIRDADGKLLDTVSVSFEKGDDGRGSGCFIEKFGLPKGRHTLTVTIVPDPDFALSDSATIDEILGETIVRDVTVDVP